MAGEDFATVTAAQAPAKTRQEPADPAEIFCSPERPMTAGRRFPLLICSIGNPGRDYADTFHSVGHTILNRLAEELGHSGFYKHHDKSMRFGLISDVTNPASGMPWTLWQSTKYMNESGIGVAKAFEAWLKPQKDVDGRLVVIHDELEKPLGNVTTKTNSAASAKGHNGLKSIMEKIGNRHGWARIGIGIGRPESRERNDVSKYVLRKMGPNEKQTIENAVGKVIEELQRLEQGW